MHFPNILRSISNRPLEFEQLLDSTRGKVSFSSISIDMKAFNFARLQTSYCYYSSFLNQDNKSYTIPKALEDCFRAGELHMIVWELKDDVFTDKRECWRGKYCVWYPPADGKFYLTKLGDGGVGYVDVPTFQQEDFDFWFRPEMAAIREKLVETYGR